MHGLSVWRHAKTAAAPGQCIGRSDVTVDRRKSKRLAHCIRTAARRERLPRVVITSPLRRARDVGRWLASWGWAHRVDARLAELDFGTWEGRHWDAIGAAAVEAWCADFANHRPGGGEPVAALLERCAAFIADQRTPVCVVGHAGWLSAALWWQEPHAGAPDAAAWPAAVRHGERVLIRAADPAASASSPGGSACSAPTAHRARCRPTR